MKFGLNIDYYLSAHTRELNLLLLRAGWQLWVLNCEGAAVELGFFVRFFFVVVGFWGFLLVCACVWVLSGGWVGLALVLFVCFF